MLKMEIKTEITINAKPNLVWDVLVNFKEYNNWNPFIKSITGDAKVGNKLEVNFEKITFKPTVLVFDKNKEFKWIGHLFFTGLFDGTHKFELIDNNNGSTTLLHSESFKGILVPLFKKKLLKETKIGFEQMNEALKIEAEKLGA